MFRIVHSARHPARASRALPPLALLVAAAFALPASAEEAHGVMACDSLIALRVLMSRPAPQAEPGCRAVDRAQVGSVERRAMVGGAPFECMAVAGADTCLWILP